MVVAQNIHILELGIGFLAINNRFTVQWLFVENVGTATIINITYPTSFTGHHGGCATDVGSARYAYALGNYTQTNCQWYKPNNNAAAKVILIGY